jgi:hypothetical protein
MYGSDGAPSILEHYSAEHVAKDLSILRDVIGVSEAQLDMFFWGACEAFWQE